MLWTILLVALCAALVFFLGANVFYMIRHLLRKEYQGAGISLILIICQILILLFVLDTREMFQDLAAWFH